MKLLRGISQSIWQKNALRLSLKYEESIDMRGILLRISLLHKEGNISIPLGTGGCKRTTHEYQIINFMFITLLIFGNILNILMCYIFL